MKALKLLSLGFFATSIMACAQKKNVPTKVTAAFTSKFPTAKSVKWDKESETEWEAEFKMDKVEYSANFENDGTWKETEHEVKMSEVPEMVKSTLMKDYADYKIKESEISETSSGTVYEFEVKKGEKVIEIAIDMYGKMINKTDITSEDNDNENN